MTSSEVPAAHLEIVLLLIHLYIIYFTQIKSVEAINKVMRFSCQVSTSLTSDLWSGPFYPLCVLRLFRTAEV